MSSEIISRKRGRNSFLNADSQPTRRRRTSYRTWTNGHEEPRLPYRAWAKEYERQFKGQKEQIKELEQSRDNSGRLCRRCSRLKFDDILSARQERLERQIIDFGNKNELKAAFSPFCAFCRLISEAYAIMRPSTQIEDGYHLSLYAKKAEYLLGAEYKLSSIRDSEISFQLCATKPQMIHFGTNGYISWINPPNMRLRFQVMKTRLIRSESIDFDIIQDWLCRCQETHGPSCNIRDARYLPPHMLINCETRTIEKANSEVRYAALSYVWGPSEASSRDTTTVRKPSLSDQLPRTIEDAMLVTRKLQLKYLWVDRYCILESSKRGKHDEIRRMDQIYHGAEITLVAAAGNDPEFGLPGVEKTPRIRQPRAIIGDYIFASTMSDEWAIVHSSTWMSRAWTLQEAICSRRLLIFTTQQVYFECEEMNCQETVFWRDNRTRLLNMFKQQDWARNPYRLIDLIGQYTSRKSTYESDALNAMLGVLRRFEHANDPTRHFWGVPILPFIVKPNVFDTPGQAQVIHLSKTRGFLAGLCWVKLNGCQRRAAFPTWSWTGWTCKVHYPWVERHMTADIHILEVSNVPIDLSVNVSSGRYLAFQEFSKSHVPGTEALQHIQAIRLTALIVDLEAKHLKDHGVNSIDGLEVFAHPSTRGETRGAFLRIFPLEELRKGSESSWCYQNPNLIGVFIAKFEEWAESWAFMIVAKKVHGGYERVGHIKLQRGFLNYRGGGRFYNSLRQLNTSLEKTRGLRPWFEQARLRTVVLK